MMQNHAQRCGESSACLDATPLPTGTALTSTRRPGQMIFLDLDEGLSDRAYPIMRELVLRYEAEHSGAISQLIQGSAWTRQ